MGTLDMAFFTNTINTRLCVLLFCTIFLGGSTVQAATIQINTSSASLSPGGIATLSVVVNSEGTAINNAEAKIAFPADLLEVVSISKGGSIFSLWVEEPAYSNVTGNITFNGGIPAPGFTGSSGTALSVVVKAKKAGQADVLFSDAAVRANDGLGTNVLHTKIGRTLSIKEAPAPAATPEPALTALQITSPTHPVQELWYTDNSPIFRWKVPTGVTTIQTGVDNNTAGSPRVSYSPVISEKTVPDLQDGIWYFKARARKGGEWGPTSTYIARVDTTVPKMSGVVFSYDEAEKVLTISADAIDETSGLDYYEIYINDELAKKVPSGEFVSGSYRLTADTPGNNTVTLVAADRAGNRVESSGTFKVPVAPEPTLVPKDQLMITIGSFTISALSGIIILLLIIIILMLISFRLGYHYGRLHHRLAIRTALSNGDNTKMLLVVKKRLEKHLEALQHTRHNRILSKEEKEIKESIEGDLDELDQAIAEQKTPE
jgi:hypothetical protein